MILITGMQRSGTSLVCQLLSTLGVSFGDPAAHLPGDRWNPEGYFEVRDVMDANSLVITGLPRHGSAFTVWLSKVAYLGMPRAAAIAARAPRHRAAIEALGERYHDGALKDPRFCLTLRWWLQWTRVQCVVVCLRDPAAVVDSMRRRHNMPRWLGARFYAWHVDALLEQLPPATAVFVDVDRLVAGDGDELDALRHRLALGGGPPSSALLRDVVQSAAFATTYPPLPDSSVGIAAWRRLLAFAAAHRSPLARHGAS